MKTSIQIAAGLLLALPLLAGAQSTPTSPVLPADQPRTPLEQQQTQQNGEATKYGQPGSDNTANGIAGHKDKASQDHSTGKAGTGNTAESRSGVAPKKAETPTSANPGK